MHRPFKTSMFDAHPRTRAPSGSTAALLATLATASCATAEATSAPPAASVVLVHGALTDASVWAEVASRLQHDGYRVIAPAMPLRGLASDAAYLASVLATVQGPVVLVGHSWAGQVISQAATTSASVKALVYIAAFQPDDGETAGALNGQFPGSKLGPDTTLTRAYPGGTDLYLAPASFRDVYAGDVPADKAAVMAAMQRPIDPAALGEPLQGHAAWHTIPSWALVSTRDHSIPTAALRFMARRAHSHIEEVESSHAIPVSHPDAVVGVIEQAARATVR
jgi:pimeloyl-ACP methyl ester carboxylesterase